MQRRSDLKGHSVFFGYDTASLEALEWCRDRGIPCVLDQTDPSRVEVELVREEEKRWPGWAARPTDVPEEFFHRHQQEWTLADRVIVNSRFCREALVSQGVSPAKLVVIPLCYERQSSLAKRNPRPQKGTLRVLWLGQVMLRKGIQYLIEAAKLLAADDIRFDVVGPMRISPKAIASAPPKLVFHGRATRDQAGSWYRQADVFVLPTLSDGFAITQLEAMSYGLPVVTTPCCGEVVTDCSDGFIVPPRNPGALAKALHRYLVEPGLLESQQEQALSKSNQFSLDHLAANLHAVEAGLGGNESPY